MKFIGILFLITTFSIQAQDMNSDQEKHAGPGRGKRRPPKVAIEACKINKLELRAIFKGERVKS